MLEVKKLSKNYKEFSLSINEFNVESNSIVGLVGENGAGKTTLIRCITNYITDYTGDIFIDGIKYTGAQEELSQIISYMSEEMNFFEDLSVRDHLSIAKNMSKYWCSEKCDLLIHILKIKPKAILKTLSRGNRVKLGLIIALSRLPKLLILDEPTSGLDPIIHEEILEQISIVKNEGSAVLFSSHIIDDIKLTADKVAIIKNGHLMPNELLRSNIESDAFKEKILEILK